MHLWPFTLVSILTSPLRLSTSFLLNSSAAAVKNVLEHWFFSLTFWFVLVAVNFFVFHGVFVVYAFLVAPFAVTVNVMLLVLSLMCLIYIMALVFTVCASVGSRRCLRSSADCVVTICAAMLIPLLLAVICVLAYCLFSVVSLSILQLKRTVFPCY